ncbi:MAG: helix-turn-helix transcriptional regulator [Flavobacteriales bacterium]|jgi:AraC-like DNA-binding protein|nr:helix-turn-helix transcriptional regulator [Flavobacteriales bacterium]
MVYEGALGEYLNVDEITSNQNCHILKEKLESGLTLLWFENDNSIIEIDNVRHCFHKNEVVFLTEFHQVVPIAVSEVKMIRFNRAFYCIIDHDSEVSCKGLLFFGANQLPVIQLDGLELEKIETLWKMFLLEMQSVDNLQLEMLQMMLKRFLILCTRIYKANHLTQLPENNKVDLVREFNFLVEQHFKEKHTVVEYAELLYKSPKTIANLFKKYANKSPLQYIQERRMLEARRLLRFTDYTIKEVAYEIGFKDIQTFSRFFKKMEGVAPRAFKEKV